MLKIWFVDDMPTNHRQWLNSFSAELRQKHSFRVFSQVESLFETLDSGLIPDVLFVDFFIGPRFGHEVIAYFADKSPRPLLIAHSSMLRANQAMLKQGADLMLEKINGGEFSESIVRLIRSEQDLYRLLGA
ncbi:MAG: hypothetical protein ACAI44_28360 [Candidatus Sericytochromatia bacterium]